MLHKKLMWRNSVRTQRFYSWVHKTSDNVVGHLLFFCLSYVHRRHNVQWGQNFSGVEFEIQILSINEKSISKVASPTSRLYQYVIFECRCTSLGLHGRSCNHIENKWSKPTFSNCAVFVVATYVYFVKVS